MTFNLTQVEVALLINALEEHVDRMFARCEQMVDGPDKARLETLACILDDIGDVLSEGEEKETLQ